MNRRTLAVTAFALSLGPIALAQSQSKSPAADAQPIAVLLEQGIYQEETAANLEAAAKTYHQIAEQAAVTRSLVAQALYRLAAVQIKQKQIAEASGTLERLRTEYPEQKDLIAKAQAILPASAPAQTTVKHTPTAEEKATSQALVAQGQQLLQDRKFDQAAKILHQAVQNDPTSVPALNAWGWAVLNGGGQAGSIFESALILDPKDVAALNGLGWFAKTQQGNNQNAIDYWQRAVDVDPAATSAMAGLAQTATEMGRYDEAVAWYDKWLKADPQNADANIGINAAKQLQASVKDARAAVDKFLKRLDDGQYAESLELYGGQPAVVDASEVQKWEDYMKAQRAPLGKLAARKVDRTEATATVGGGGGGGRGGRGGGGRGGGGGIGGPGGFFGGGSMALGRSGGGFGQSVDASAVEFQFITQFDHKKDVYELVTAAKSENGEWRIANYRITTPKLGVDPIKAR